MFNSLIEEGNIMLTRYTFSPQNNPHNIRPMKLNIGNSETILDKYGDERIIISEKQYTRIKSHFMCECVTDYKIVTEYITIKRSDILELQCEEM
jgi:hypothetical protein